MKRILKLILIVVLSFLLALVATFSLSVCNMQKSFETELYGNIVRLHILADSDSESDQAAKVEIKDHVVDYISELTENADDADEASAIIKESVFEINQYVNNVSKKLGYEYDISVSFSEERYPVRYYEGFAFPAGTYRSLRIKLGSGKGKNWWCVLYPSICVSPAQEVGKKLEEAGVSEETTRYICEDEKYKIRFRFLEWLGF